MANNTIYLDADGISEASAQASFIASKIVSTQQELISLKNQLSSSVDTLEDYFGICFTEVIPTGELGTQSMRVTDIKNTLSMAQSLTDEENDYLEKESGKISFVFAAVASILSTVWNGLTGASYNGDVYVEVERTMTPEKIQELVAARTADILESDNLPKVGADKYQNNGGKQINCVWLARQKICDILGDDTLFSDSHKLGIKKSNWANYEATGINGYSVDYREVSSGTTVSDILSRLENDQPCSVMFYFDGHTVTVDQIADGTVYWTDNFTPGGQSPLYKTGVSTSVFDGVKYPGSYTGLATTATLDNFAKWYDTNVNGSLLSYVVLKEQ